MLKAIGTRQKWRDAEANFQQARTVARQQQAKCFELRAAMGLSRLWQQQGKCEAAQQLLKRAMAGSPQGLTFPTCRQPGRFSMR